MNFGKILKRAWQILWSYRALWVFGLILALTAGGGSFNGSGNSGGSSGNNGGYQYHYNGPQLFNDGSPQSFSDVMKELGPAFNQVMSDIARELGVKTGDLVALFWGIIIMIGVMFLISLAMVVLRYVAETATIRMVDEYEGTGEKVSIRQGFRYGWSRTSFRLWVINLIVSLPVILLMLLFLVLGLWIFFVLTNGGTLSTVAIVTIIGVVFVAILVTVLLSIFLNLLRHFYWRACALENLGIGASLRRGYAMFKANWKNAGLMWLIMVGLGIAWAVAGILLFFILLPTVLLTGIAGVAVAAIPTLLVAGLSSLFMGGWLPWIVGAFAGLPLFFIVAFSPYLLIQGWALTYASTVWTLVYREFKAMESLAPQLEEKADSAQ